MDENQKNWQEELKQRQKIQLPQEIRNKAEYHEALQEQINKGRQEWVKKLPKESQEGIKETERAIQSFTDKKINSFIFTFIENEYGDIQGIQYNNQFALAEKDENGEMTQKSIQNLHMMMDNLLFKFLADTFGTVKEFTPRLQQDINNFINKAIHRLIFNCFPQSYEDIYKQPHPYYRKEDNNEEGTGK